MTTQLQIPKHIAVIMDGNRRWARKHNLPAIKGHLAGYRRFKKITEFCYKTGVKILTFYAFSTENWNRSKKEVGYLMKLLAFILKKEIKTLKKKNIKLNIIGQIERLPTALRKLAGKAKEETKNNTKHILNIALSYGGRAEITDAVKKIINAQIKPAELDEILFNKYIYTAGQPDPDLLIRTGGEQRLSGFLPWQTVYTELYFSEKLWPDFTEDDLEEAIKEFQKRQRRFGQ